MTRKWVGWIITIAMFGMLWVGPAVSAPHPDYMRDDFINADGSGWDLVAGNLTFNETFGSAGDLLSWMVVDDDDDAAGVFPSRVRADPATINTTLSAYAIHAIIERDPTYIAPGDSAPTPRWIGISFGEVVGEGYFLARFNTAPFLLAVPNATSGGSDLVHVQFNWNDVPAWVNDVDKRHRYSLLVDGTTLTVKVDGWVLGSFTLPRIPAGTFGIVAGDDTRVYVEQIVYGPLDVEPPTIDIWRPADGTVYVDDEPIDVPCTGCGAVVLGDFQFGADISDNLTGTKVAYVRVDGKMVAGSARVDPGIEETWLIDTSGLDLGYHSVGVEAYDFAGNKAYKEVRFLMVGAPGPSTLPAVEEAAQTVLGFLP